jgi:thymidylate synthase (FAD)
MNLDFYQPKLSTDGTPYFTPEIHKTKSGVTYLREPGVAVIGRTTGRLSSVRGFLEGYDAADYLNDPAGPLVSSEVMMKFAGQLCYLAFDERRTKNAEGQSYFDKILQSKHGSVIEHASVVVLLWGISRALTHELVRHRAGVGFSQVSQRYVDPSRVRFVEGVETQNDPAGHTLFEQHVNATSAMYAERVAYFHSKMERGDLSGTEFRKKLNQAARRVLPNETEAPIVVSANMRAWRHMLEMRGSQHSDEEIRRCMIRVFACLKVLSPAVFHDFKFMESASVGTFIEPQYSKV